MSRRGSLLACGIAIGLLWQTGVFAQDPDEEAEYNKFLQEQQKGVEDLSKEYEDFERQERLAYETFAREVEKQWRVFQGSTTREWVEYSPGKDAKSYVNFEEGMVEVEAVVPATDAGAVDKARQKVFSKLKTLLSAGHSAKENVLADQVKTASGGTVTAQNVDAFTRELTGKKSIVEVEPVTGTDGVKRVRVRATFRLVPDHLRIRAARYLASVRRYAGRNGIDPRHVFAVIHTESFFNPLARSNAPAYGLMQLVPRTGGSDAYRYVYGSPRMVTPEYLYDPERNLELGIAYLALLRNRYFRGVEDTKKMLYATTCAYNTGAGNVSIALTGTKNLNTAIARINGLSPQELYDHLMKDLPRQETRDYLKLVVSRMGHYEEWKE